MNRANRRRFFVPSQNRARVFEKCEERNLMAADVADLAIREVTDAMPGIAAAGSLQTLAEGHGWTDIEYVRNTYGLTGANQAVAIIDSGIAYDHVALGGGLGSGKKVIGGWDFAENDSNPYDDGPSGFHGTHVAGIVAAKDGTYPGVAPDASLVGLRVFADDGSGNFSWVESALRWVHTNRNALGVNITTVNLSLGTEWNASNTPAWAMLEDEFAQLKADGIFISVAAGNSFASYNSPGLSYPAVSPYVVPVSSIGATGLFSKFSQRDARAIAAPGERIMSTVPDHFTGGDGVKNDWSAASGTSMAAPYMAGASLLVREAMKSFGRTTINQDEIYAHLRNTADTFFDTATNANYLKLNTRRAIDSLSGADDFSNSANGAFSWGRLGTSQTYAGKFNTLGDSDYFSFVADRTGVMQFSASSLGGGTQTWQVVGGASAQGTLSLNVQAGQTYTLGLSSTGIGNYTITETIVGAPVTPPANTPPATTPPASKPPTATPPANPPPVVAPPAAVNWGTIEANVFDNVKVNGTSTFTMKATRNGFLTIEAAQTGGNGVMMEVLSSTGTRLSYTTVTKGIGRVDAVVTAGQSYTLKITGTTNDIDFKAKNLASLVGGKLEINGTSGNDTFNVDLGANSASINGTTYSFGGATTVSVRGANGTDTLTLTGSASSTERLSMSPGTVNVTGGKVAVQADSFEAITANVQRADSVTIQDGKTNDVLDVSANTVSLTGTGFSLIANGMGTATVNATAGGVDTGNFRAAAGAPTVNRTAGTITVSAAGTTVIAKGIESGFTVSSVGAKVGVRAADAFVEDEYGGDVYSPITGLGATAEEVAVMSAGGNDRPASSSTVAGQEGEDSAFNRGVFDTLDVELEVLLATVNDLRREVGEAIGGDGPAASAKTDPPSLFAEDEAFASLI